MLTVQMLTKNNSETVEKAIESVAALNAPILIGDLGSEDKTVELCKSLGGTVYQLAGLRRDRARNFLIAEAGYGPALLIEPWEMLIKGHKLVPHANACHEVTILANKIITKEIRIWSGKQKFVNPVYERLDAMPKNELEVVFYSVGGPNVEDMLAGVAAWKAEEPFVVEPHYYHACLLLSKGDHDGFLKMADHYLHLDKSVSVATTMTRYYYAMVQLMYRHDYKAALQNLNLCMCAKPLMAEFWCLTGDVFYHLLHRFEQAKDFYENAIVLGGRRLRSDKWPMDIAKYGSYPRKMIESCDKIIGSPSIYQPVRSST